MQMAVLCYIQPLNNDIFNAYEYVLRPSLSATPIRILSVNKIRLHYYENSSSMYTKYVCDTSFGAFEEVGAKSLLQLSPRNRK